MLTLVDPSHLNDYFISTFWLSEAGQINSKKNWITLF